jgi:N6-L-threonylcarbamoyladenine synthase
MKKTILAIESSCDETSIAIVTDNDGVLSVASNIVSSQIDIHKEYGGVVPEVAARHHVKNIIPVLQESMDTAGVSKGDIDAIAVTAGPGLMTSLIVGVETAKSLAVAWGKPVLGVNHMYAHIAANFLNNDIVFPALALVVSGGHTELVLVEDHSTYRKIGQTVDDAVGEAFDKVAKMMNLGYPGGPIVSQRAAQGDGTRFALPRPMAQSGDYNFSFSGLKTAVLYKLKEIDLDSEQDINDMCASFEDAAVDVLISKTMKAVDEYGIKTVFMAGGVAANKKLRSKLEEVVTTAGLRFLVPDFQYCTDNAGMIGIAAHFLIKKEMPTVDNYKKIKADPNWELE